MSQVLDELKGIMTTPTPQVKDDPNAPYWERRRYVLNPFQEIPELDTFCTMGGRPALPRQGVVTFSGKPKQGKSTAARALLIPLLTGESFDTITPSGERPDLVITFDLEMPERTIVKRTLATMKQVGDMEGRHYIVVPVKGVEVRKRMDYIADIINDLKPDIAIIDQIAMLVEDYNDSKEATRVKNWLIDMGKRCALWAIIHQNKAKDNDQMKGHLGTLAGEGNDENYSVTHENGIFKVTPVEARDTLIDKSTAGFTFLVDDEQMIVSADARKEALKWEEMKEKGREFLHYFEAEGKSELGYNELVRAMVNESVELGDKPIVASTADNRITAARELGVLIKGEGRLGKYWINPKILELYRPGVFSQEQQENEATPKGPQV